MNLIILITLISLPAIMSSVKLNVGGTIFQTSQGTLSGTKIERILEVRAEISKNKKKNKKSQKKIFLDLEIFLNSENFF